jgi:iron complex transport system substrate-binding protein
MAYMGLTDKVGYIESNDLKRVVPYMIAFPELKKLPIIGAGNNYDPEALAVSGADMLISTYMNREEAEVLSAKTGKTVFCINYGDLVHYKEDFYSSLRMLGQLFDKMSKADTLISYIESTIREVENRSKMQISERPTVYIGGIAFNGVQGITSTRAQYPPFVYLNLNSPVDKLPYSLESIGMGQKNMLIDIEQIMDWNVDYMFLDASGQPMWSSELTKPAFNNLHSVIEEQIYTVLPFNWHTINYENLLCNMWFVGKILYPASFADVDVDAKCREIFSVFYGRDIYNEVKEIYQPFEKINVYVK